LHSINSLDKNSHNKGISLNVVGRSDNVNEGKLISSNIRNSRVISNEEWKQLLGNELSQFDSNHKPLQYSGGQHPYVIQENDLNLV